MNSFGVFLGLIGMILVIDAVLAIGFGERYVTVVVDYTPVEYTNFVHDLTNSPIETQLFMRLGEIFMGFILIMLAQKTD